MMYGIFSQNYDTETLPPKTRKIAHTTNSKIYLALLCTGNNQICVVGTLIHKKTFGPAMHKKQPNMYCRHIIWQSAF